MDLRATVERSLREGRTKQALELTKQLYKQEPTPEHRRLLRDVYRQRGRQLHGQGFSREAATVLENALALDDNDPTWLAAVAEELATYGHSRRALEIVQSLPEVENRGHILGTVADAAVCRGLSGRDLLPAEWHSQFELVVRAFAELEAGRDETAREMLQEIGVRSPFLEWKLLARGLSAYYRNEDARAVENWQRLSPERLPDQLAAPLRFRIDPEYRRAQTPQSQPLLQKKADRLQETSLVKSLRALQAALVVPDELPRALRLAEKLRPVLQAPAQLDRLASCLYWSIVACGEPEDVTLYGRIFGSPADDPGLDRLHALRAEKEGDLQQAHGHWQRFEQSVSKNPGAWHGQADRARALVWWHMGNNAVNIPGDEALEALPPFLRDHPDRPRPLKPPADACYQRSLELAPERLPTHEALVHYYEETQQYERAEQSARRLLAQFPGHAGTLETLADLLLRRRACDEAVQCYREALQANPLERRLRSKLSTAHAHVARVHAEASAFDQARAAYRAALDLGAGDDAALLCKWAACEFKAGAADRAEELIRDAGEHCDSRLPVAYYMAIEASRLNLPPRVKKRFEGEFQAGLSEAPTAAAAVALSQTAAAHHGADISYRGRKTHEKKILAYLEKTLSCPYRAEQAEAVAEALLMLEAMRFVRRFLAQARNWFPDNPYLWYLEAESYFVQGPSHCQPWRVAPLLDNAAKLAGRLPTGDKQQELLDRIEERQQLLRLANPFGGLIDSLVGAFADAGNPCAVDDDCEEAEEIPFGFFGSGRPRKRTRR